MKVVATFGVIATLAGPATAFYGQMAANALTVTGEGPAYQLITLTDYNTGSIYSGDLNGGFRSEQATVFFGEDTPGGYDFYALMWETDDGCYNIDFQGALSAGHGWCCGSLPCDFTA
ncbi:hypothetical protein TASIC1_0013014300 [Trichoderma asperellum]|uniref:Uncharacterized protein n=1 Tax=Trichoderma asperellum TaxID=101201 RepID=A0A6V8R340_TRIAP|nr:hypothetical protein TASIC1_0013014300 [Trichoderma asperellum]